MGSDYISVIDMESFKRIRTINVGVNPRHLIRFDNYIYCSLNLGAKLVKIDTTTEKVLQKADTGRSPRTISITKDGKYIFVTCYNADQLQVFDADSLKLIGSWESKRPSGGGRSIPRRRFNRGLGGKPHRGNG